MTEDKQEEPEPFEFSKFGTREWEVQLWTMEYTAYTYESVAYCAKRADEAVLELRKRL